jgi:hypothetical protein
MRANHPLIATVISPHPVMFHTENVTDLDIFSCTLFNWCLRDWLLCCSYLMLVLFTNYKSIMIFLYFKGQVCKWMEMWTFDNLMLCWLCIIVYECSKTNVTYFLYSVYRELTASVCYEHHLLTFRRPCTNSIWYRYCVCVMSVGCTSVQPTDITHTKCASRWFYYTDWIACFYDCV